ncbi:DUF6328 family protein [Georgenia sp. 10Sc9-8]|uniref:DUF6328 family protein n=1 Tax=Georgenia halotolerans TaxID=3028317 RepID=A0ABT5U3A0_9MICO|nr:DUF6328 family protein [Georgenia halotolerans]
MDPGRPGGTRREPGATQREQGRLETPEERSDRNWVELLQELRVTQTGAQILTGFLLTLPFQGRFTELTSTQVGIYLVLVLLAATTTVLVVAPVSLHRLRFQRRVKREVVQIGHRTAMVGLAFLALVVTGTVLLIFDVVVGRGAAVVAAGSVLLLVAVAWLLVPTVFARVRSGGEEEA